MQRTSLQCCSCYTSFRIHRHGPLTPAYDLYDDEAVNAVCGYHSLDELHMGCRETALLPCLCQQGCSTPDCNDCLQPQYAAKFWVQPLGSKFPSRSCTAAWSLAVVVAVLFVISLLLLGAHQPWLGTTRHETGCMIIISTSTRSQAHAIHSSVLQSAHNRLISG